jgi:cell division control protein 6
MLDTANNRLIILDEIDSLSTPHLLSRLFTLPYNTPTKLITISNTLDLTLRARLTLPCNLQPLILPFKAYSGMDMVPIITARIDAAGPDAAKVDIKAIELLTKKVEAQNGDLRMCLGVMSAAVSLAEGEWLKKGGPLVKVALPHTIKAFTNRQLKASAGSGTCGTSATGKKVKSVPLQGKMVLVSLLVFLARARAGLAGNPSSGVTTPPSTPTKGEQLTTGNLYAAYVHLLSHHSSPFPPASESDYRDLLSNLEVLGLVGTKTGTRKTGRVELLVREEEVAEGLGLVSGTKGLAEEEVGKIWEREEGKIKRVKEKPVVEGF